MKNLVCALGVLTAFAAMPAVAAAQTFTPNNFTSNISGTAALSHTVSLSCSVAAGDIKVQTKSTSSNSSQSVTGVTRPFAPLIPCGAVSVPSYAPWKVEVLSGSGGTYSARIFVSALTISGSLCEGWVNGTFTNGSPSKFIGSGTIPVVSGPSSPPNCTVSVNLNVPGITATP